MNLHDTVPEAPGNPLFKKNLAIDFFLSREYPFIMSPNSSLISLFAKTVCVCVICTWLMRLQKKKEKKTQKTLHHYPIPKQKPSAFWRLL